MPAEEQNEYTLDDLSAGVEQTPEGSNRSVEDPVEFSLGDGLVSCSRHLHVLVVDHQLLGVADLFQQLVEEFVEDVLHDLLRPLDEDYAEQHDVSFSHVYELQKCFVP